VVSKNPRIRHKNTPPCEQEVFFHERFFMPKPYSVDLRERVLKDCDHGMSSEDAARKYSVSISWVYLLRKQRRETGNIAPKKRPKSYHLKLSPYEAEIRQLIADHPDATLVELHSMLSNKDNVTVVTLHNFLHHLKLHFPKNCGVAATQIPYKLRNLPKLLLNKSAFFPKSKYHK